VYAAHVVTTLCLFAAQKVTRRTSCTSPLNGLGGDLYSAGNLTTFRGIIALDNSEGKQSAVYQFHAASSALYTCLVPSIRIVSVRHGRPTRKNRAFSYHMNAHADQKSFYDWRT
jgi:hypothetical protein